MGRGRILRIRYVPPLQYYPERGQNIHVDESRAHLVERGRRDREGKNKTRDLLKISQKE